MKPRDVNMFIIEFHVTHRPNYNNCIGRCPYGYLLFYDEKETVVNLHSEDRNQYLNTRLKLQKPLRDRDRYLKPFQVYH